MRAIVIADFAIPSGGAQRVAVESARALAETGVDVTFLHAVVGSDPVLDHPGVERVCANVPDIWSRASISAAINGVWSRQAEARARAAMAPYVGARDTVIHLHQWTRAFSPSIFQVLRESRLPVAITAHDYFLGCPNGVLFRFDTHEVCSLAPMSARCVATNCDTRSYPHKLVRVARQMATNRQFGGWTPDIIHIADRARDRLAPLLPATWRHHRIDNPIGAERASPVEIGPDAEFAVVGRLTEEKGAILAARAAAAAGARILFIGDGPARADIAALLPGATITGWVGPAEVAALLRARGRAILAPSLWPETGPLTVSEAAAIGLPAIVSSRCGAAEKVADGVGVVVAPTVEDIAAAMARLMDDTVARAMGRAAHAAFWSNAPTPANHAARLVALYETMLRR
jgi:glycosyltransferase involved in cell wall biosynthesis